VQREVESLLAQSQGTEGFLEAPALDVAARDLATLPSRAHLRTRRPLAATALFGCSAKVAWELSTKLGRKNHAALSL